MLSKIYYIITFKLGNSPKNIKKDQLSLLNNKTQLQIGQVQEKIMFNNLKQNKIKSKLLIL